MEKSKILLIDDNKSFLDDLSDFLESENYSTLKALSVKEGEKIIHKNNIQSVIIDLKFEQEDKEKEFGGLKLFHLLHKVKASLNLIILSAYPFEDQKANFLMQLKQLRNSDENIDEILEKFHSVYICKIGENTYTERVLSMLKIFENKLLMNCKDFWHQEISLGCLRTRKLITDLSNMLVDNVKKNAILIRLSECTNHFIEKSSGVAPININLALHQGLLLLIGELKNDDFNPNKLVDYAILNKIK